MRAWQSPPQLLVLQAARLAGFASPGGIAERVELESANVSLVLEVLADKGLVEPFEFGPDHGWIVTETGRAHADSWVREEVLSADAETVLASSAAGFESLNGELVRVISRWQLDGTEVGDVLATLARLERELTATLHDLTEHLPRFGRYPSQFAR